MGARKYDLVQIDKDAVLKEISKFGMNGHTFSERCGRQKNWLSSVLSRGMVERDVVAFIEERLFKEPGAFIIEVDNDPAEPAKPVMSEGTGILLKQILGEVGALSAKADAIRIEPNMDKVIYRLDGFKAGNDRKMDEMMKALKETQAANELLLRDLLQKEKEVCTLAAKILSALERRANV